MRNTNSGRGPSKSGGRTPFKKSGQSKSSGKSFGTGSRDKKSSEGRFGSGRSTRKSDEFEGNRPARKSYGTGSRDNKGGENRFGSGRSTRKNEETEGFKPRRSAGPGRERNSDDRGKRSGEYKSYGAGKKSFSSRSENDRDQDKKPYARKTSATAGDRKKAYGSSEGYKERKSLKSIHEQRSESAQEEKYTTKKTRFSKKSELKGFKSKKSDSVELPKNASRNQAKELVTENLLKAGESIRLNRYISNAGVCSRREADELIGAGLVSINGNVVTELGTKVNAGDVVRFNGEKLNVEAKVYILLNKPKDAITTADDPEGRNTVMDIFDGKLKERIFPVGRLDRNTTGVLLLTNDGELAQRLMHPKYEVKKVYKATLNKNIKSSDIWTMANGLELEDGFIKPDAIATPDPKAKDVVGIEIHSGRNRIIHRMFEHIGYVVDKLDRVLYAGLEKGNLKRGEWRELTDKELKSLKRMLHMK